MGTAKHVGRIGAWPVATGIRNVRHAGTRMTLSIGVAALVVMATAVPVPVSTVSSPVRLSTSTDSTALLMGATSGPTLNKTDVEDVMNQFIAPTHGGQTIKPVAVTTPEEFWPITGLIRLICRVICDPRIFGPGGAAWPDEPWWKLSGLFDLTIDQSVRAGVADLEDAMAEHGNDDLVINGYSQGAMIAIREKQRLAEQFPEGTKAPDIDFVVGGDPEVPNGGLLARFPGLYIPVLDWWFTGAEPTDTQFDTVVFTRQYDFFADFPLYPLNLVADLNAVLGGFYVHGYPFGVSLVRDPSTSPPIHSKTGDTDYYFFETQDLPLFGPLRTLGVPESFIDVVEPFFRVLVELGYDRSIPLGKPTPARLIPRIDPATVAVDLADAIGEGINNAAALFGSPLPSLGPAPATLAAPGAEAAKADTSPHVASTPAALSTDDVTETGNADVARQATPTETVPETGKVMSAEKVTETVGADEPSTEPRAASASNSGSATTGPALHGSRGRREHLRHLLDHRNNDHPITRTVAADDGTAKAGSTPVESSSAASSSTDTDSPKGNSSGASADDS